MEGEVSMLLKLVATWVQRDKDTPELTLSLALLQDWGCPACSPQVVKSWNHKMFWAGRDLKLEHLPLDQVAQMCLFVFWGRFCSGLFSYKTMHAVVALPRANTITILMEELCKHIFMITACEIQSCTGQGKKKSSWKWHEREQCPTLLTPPV